MITVTMPIEEYERLKKAAAPQEFVSSKIRANIVYDAITKRIAARRIGMTIPRNELSEMLDIISDELNKGFAS